MIEIFENIRKIYAFRAPCFELMDHIEFFSESSSDATRQHIQGQYFSVRMFPSWTPTMYINLGEPYFISVGNYNFFVSHDQDILILRDSIVERQNSLSDHIFTIKFLPGSLEDLFGIPPDSLLGQATDLRSVLPARILQQIKQAENFDERVLLAENFLVMKIGEKKDHRLHSVREVISAYSEAGMRPNINELAGRSFTSSKTLNRYFHRVIGTSPKNYFSTVRARTALHDYVDKGAAFSPSAFGYFDMSHFYKDVIQFTGQKLTAFTRK